MGFAKQKKLTLNYIKIETDANKPLYVSETHKSSALALKHHLVENSGTKSNFTTLVN